MTEGSKEFREQIEKNVKQQVKLEIGTRVKVKESAKSGLHGQEGIIEEIGSMTPITEPKNTKVAYLVRIDVTNLLYLFCFDEIKPIITSEKVQFT